MRLLASYLHGLAFANFDNNAPREHQLPDNQCPKPDGRIPRRSPEEIAHRFFPAGLPFPSSRLNKLIPQMVDQREQWLDPRGSFIATDYRALPTGGQRVTAAITKAEVAVFLIGDMGFASAQQHAVFRSLQEQIQSLPAHTQPLIVGNGDWAYPHGPENDSAAERKRLDETVLNQAKALAVQTPFLGVFGNHEFGDDSGPADPKVFLTYMQENNFVMPGRYYSFGLEGDQWGIDLLALDSTTLPVDPQQQAWMTQATQQSHLQSTELDQTRWRILLSHHPLISYGHHHGRTTYLQHLLKTPLQHSDLVASAHEHDVQFLTLPKIKVPQLICGTASDFRPTQGGDYSLFHSNQASFSKLTITPSGMNTEIYGLIQPASSGMPERVEKLFQYFITK